MFLVQDMNKDTEPQRENQGMREMTQGDRGTEAAGKGAGSPGARWRSVDLMVGSGATEAL